MHHVLKTTIIQFIISLQIGLVLGGISAHAENPECEKILHTASTFTIVNWLKHQSVDYTLDLIGYMKGLPKYLKRNIELQKTKQYLQYDNFGEMGLAEMKISVQYNQEKLAALNTEKPLIIVGNHHLGIADGLALQHLSSQSRRTKPSLLFLARWIEKLLPNAIYGDKQGWGTAIPVEINKPKESDPQFDQKMAELKSFNSGWNRKSIRALKQGGALIIFPAGQVAAINKDDGKYPNNVYDAPGTWQDAVLNIARLGNADIVFAHVDSANSKSFYKNRKRFGGGDKERVIWFFSEALGKANKSIDVYLSDPVSLDTMYDSLADIFSYSKDELKADPTLTAELMRQYTYEVQNLFPQELNTKDSPEKISD